MHRMIGGGFRGKEKGGRECVHGEMHVNPVCPSLPAAAAWLMLTFVVGIRTGDRAWHLVGSARNSLVAREERARSNHASSWLVCSTAVSFHFSSGFSCDNTRRNEAVRSALARLVWSLLREPGGLRHKSCKLVSTLLASVSYRRPAVSGREGEVDHGQFLERYGSSGMYMYFVL